MSETFDAQYKYVNIQFEWCIFPDLSTHQNFKYKRLSTFIRGLVP